MNQAQKYHFSWDMLGDLQLGRPNLGSQTRLEVYRLMQFCLRDRLEQELGAQKTDQIFIEAGKLAGLEFYRHFLASAQDFGEFANALQAILKEMNVGILRFEKSDLAAHSFILTVDEDLDCSGLPEMDFEVCKYDEGFIAGILEEFTRQKMDVQEIDCWCTGSRTCRFKADVVADGPAA